MKFLTRVAANKKAEITELFNGFNQDYSNEGRTFELKGANITVIRNGVKDNHASWGFMACTCGKISIECSENDTFYCFDCGKQYK